MFNGPKLNSDNRLFITEMNEIINRAIIDRATQEAMIFEKALRTNSQPPIKDEITQGKIRWRGITMKIDLTSGTKWLDQRGEQISDKISTVIKITRDGLI